MFRSVLVADSDVESRDRFYEILFSMGHKVECVPNNNEALIRLQAERPYLLILEENLPLEGGLKTLEKIREFDREMKVVFLTKGEPDVEIETKAHRLGVTAVIKKDFSAHFMFKKILEILRQTEERTQDNKYLGLGKILVVDDNQEMRVTLTTFLVMKGFDVKDAANADQALLEMKVEKPFLVLLDERMPGMDGLVALKKIKELDSAIKVVMLTAIQDRDVMEEAKKLGALDYITKPFDLEKLEALILSILIQEKYKHDDNAEREKA
jgi:two-component system response regulator (stage 0 sporulation protein F)